MVAPRLSPLTLALLAVSCGPAAGPAPAALAPAVVAIPPAPPAETPARAAGEPAVDPSSPLSLPAAASPPPTWVEPPLAEQDRARAHQNPFREHREVAVGEHVSIAAAKGDVASAAGGPGVFAVHEKLGVVGPLKLPARSTWVGLAAGTAGPQDDALYAATPDGALHRAAGVHDALRPDGFAPRGSVAGATAWDAAGGLVAAAAGARVSVSADEGQTFTEAVVASGKRVRAVLVRPDGVLAAVVEAPSRGQRPGPPDTFLSLDRGRTWKRSAFQPRAIERAGSWIWNGDATCPAVLSRDGQQWTRAASAEALYDRPRLDGALYVSTAIRAGAAGSFRSAVAPPPPEPPARGAAAVGREPPCKRDGASGVGGVVGGVWGAYGPACEGALCLLHADPPEPPPTRTWIAAFGDGLCDPARVPPGGACAAHLARPPTFAVVDQLAGAVTPVAAPEGCPQPVALHSAAGVGVLVCRGAGGGAAIFVRGATGPWHAEGSQAIPAEALGPMAAAPDGTLLLRGPTPPASAQGREPLLALVRSPLPLGAAQAWRRIAAPDGVAALPAPGGAALLAISPAASAGGRLELALDRPGRPVLSLVRDVEVYQDLTRMEVRDDGRVRFRVLPKPAPEVPGRPRLPPPGPRDARWHELTRGGELVVEATATPAGPAEERRSGPAGR
ncbi:hypothetical protein [Sorangium cellulosum]|uniref:hypothetical protein n=1 Tax=Sorangium cellulosum TaxID=56 RepID=UPI00041D078D|nr:hypothetical protein [Sorangium cellulosum]